MERAAASCNEVYTAGIRALTSRLQQLEERLQAAQPFAAQVQRLKVWRKQRTHATYLSAFATSQWSVSTCLLLTDSLPPQLLLGIGSPPSRLPVPITLNHAGCETPPGLQLPPFQNLVEEPQAFCFLSLPLCLRNSSAPHNVKQR